MHQRIIQPAYHPIDQEDRGTQGVEDSKEQDADPRPHGEIRQAEGFVELRVFAHGRGENNALVVGIQLPHFIGEGVDG